MRSRSRLSNRTTEPPTSTAETLTELERIRHARQTPLPSFVEQDRIETVRPPSYKKVIELGAAAEDEVVANLDGDPRAEKKT